MKLCLLHGAVLVAVVAAALPSVAKAQARVTTTVTTEETTSQATGPSMAMVGSGLGIFALSYTPAVVAAATSGLNTDRTLLVPIAGPWIDLTQRPACGPDSSCNGENAAKVLIVTDGIFQAIGAVTVVGGFLTTSHRTKTVRSTGARVTFDVSPAQLAGGGYGVVAIGKF